MKTKLWAADQRYNHKTIWFYSRVVLRFKIKWAPEHAILLRWRSLNRKWHRDQWSIDFKCFPMILFDNLFCDNSPWWLFRCPVAWLVIDIWWLKRPVRVSSCFLRLSRWLTPDRWLRPPYTMDCSFSINYAPLLRALHVIACKLGSIPFDGHPIYLTHVHLYELN